MSSQFFGLLNHQKKRQQSATWTILLRFSPLFPQPSQHILPFVPKRVPAPFPMSSSTLSLAPALATLSHRDAPRRSASSPRVSVTQSRNPMVGTPSFQGFGAGGFPRLRGWRIL